MIWVCHSVLPDVIKPSSEPNLTFHQFGSILFICEKFHGKGRSYQLIESVWRAEDIICFSFHFVLFFIFWKPHVKHIITAFQYETSHMYKRQLVVLILPCHGGPSEAGDCSHLPLKMTTAENPSPGETVFYHVAGHGSLRFLAFEQVLDRANLWYSNIWSPWVRMA